MQRNPRVYNSKWYLDYSKKNCIHSLVSAGSSDFDTSQWVKISKVNKEPKIVVFWDQTSGTHVFYPWEGEKREVKCTEHLTLTEYLEPRENWDTFEQKLY